MVLLNKSCPLKLVYKEAVDQNCLKLSMKYEVTIYGIFCTYAPCWGLDTDFLLNVRRNQLNSTEDHTAIIGDLNCTLDRVLDKYEYEADHHWRCREIIKEWLDSGDLQDAFRHPNPETLSYTWKDDMLGKKPLCRHAFVFLKCELFPTVVIVDIPFPIDRRELFSTVSAAVTAP